jgi:8-oxo-dGTP pyrophosphatase MutT (NUDIX family)
VVVYTDWGAVLNVHPFLFPVEDIEVRLEREHTDYRWIEPSELYEYDFVQQLDEDLINLGLLPSETRRLRRPPR